MLLAPAAIIYQDGPIVTSAITSSSSFLCAVTIKAINEQEVRIAHTEATTATIYTCVDYTMPLSVNNRIIKGSILRKQETDSESHSDDGNDEILVSWSSADIIVYTDEELDLLMQ